jgi:hypothetical protein
VPIKRNRREPMTRRQRRSSLFHYRLIITIPAWGVFVMAGAIAIALLAKPLLMTNIIALIVTAVALLLIKISRREVKHLRYEVHEALNNIGNEDLILNGYGDDIIDNRPDATIKLKKVNGNSSSRVSE